MAKFAEFAVNGADIPEVDFGIFESYAGRLPVSGEMDKPKHLYF
jgi:hypothetical protein